MTNTSHNILIRKLVDSLFFPARIEHRRLLSGPLLALVFLTAISFALLSLPVVQEIIWATAFTDIERTEFVSNKGVRKAWFVSVAYILDIGVAIFIGGSIFGEKLAKSLSESIEKYEENRERVLSETASYLEAEIEDSLKNSIRTIRQIRQGGMVAVITEIPTLISEAKRLYDAAFEEVPQFYKGYIRFVFYSSFPGGLYGLFAFIFFFLSAGCKLVAMYLGSPFLVP